jgi:hypothetical protein
MMNFKTSINWFILIGAAVCLTLVASFAGSMAYASELTKAEHSASLQQGGVIIASPLSGVSNTLVTINGTNWAPFTNLVIYLVANNQENAIASTQAGPGGAFIVSFFMPANWTDQPTMTILARSLDGTASAQSVFSYVAEGPPPAPPAPQNPSGTITAASLNVRSGPDAAYAVLGRLSQGQTVDISGQSGGWWRIAFVSANADYGWVSGSYINAQNTANVPFVQAPPPPPPPPTTAPTPTPCVSYPM